MVVTELHGFISICSKMHTSDNYMFLSPPFFGRKVGIGHSYSSISGFQLGKFNLPRKKFYTGGRFLTTSVLSNVTKDFKVTPFFIFLFSCMVIFKDKFPCFSLSKWLLYVSSWTCNVDFSSINAWKTRSRPQDCCCYHFRWWSWNTALSSYSKKG